MKRMCTLLCILYITFYSFAQGAEYHTYDFRHYKANGRGLALSFYHSSTGYNYDAGWGAYFYTSSPELNEDLILTDSCIYVNGGIWLDMNGLSQYVYINGTYSGDKGYDLGMKLPYHGNVFYIDIYNIFQQLVDCFGEAIVDENGNYIYSPSKTGINGITANSSLSKQIYNLSGQKVNSSYRGIIIRNGKKYLKK